MVVTDTHYLNVLEIMNKYLYYTINPREQMFKQLAGFLYYLTKIKNTKQTLVLPRFELNNKLYNYNEFYNEELIKNNFDVINYEEYININNVKQITDYELNKFNQLPFTSLNYMFFRKYIQYKDYYYEKVKLILKDQPKYLAVHWRQDDFLKVRPHVTMNVNELINDCIIKLKKHNLNHVYIATDCKNKDKKKYIESKLPTFNLNKTLYNKIDFSIIESLICANSKYFTGTNTSLYTINIIGERLKMGYTDKDQEIKKL